MISVLMPVWNPHPAHFPAAVASVLAQTDPDWELLIVEDPTSLPLSASERGPGGEVFADPRIRHIRNSERTGLLAQRNRALAEARGEWIAWLDADDLMEPERLAKQREYLNRNPAIDMLGSQLTIIDGDGAVVGRRDYPEHNADILRAFRRYNAIAQPATMARKQTLLDAGGYTFEFPVEDYDLWSRLAKDGATFGNHPEALTSYRIGGASKTAKIRRTLQLTREVKRKYWWNEMTFADRLRYRAEGGLSLLPGGLVSSLFRKLTYRASKR